ncbi:unnamed protein product [Durusdinium trenchii]|uniref:Uncharacterized protein n=1 Tax=Durusdinium trenchii TaxID=1381693 RepID=A0ABP0HQQ1_9DINO
MTYMKEIPFPHEGMSKKVSQDLRGSSCCLHCGSDAGFLCSGCRKVRFCSPSCQQKTWKEHRKDCKGDAGEKELKELKSPPSSEQWVVIFNTDSLPGHDAGTVTSGPEAAKDVCMKKGFGGMVAWQNTFFLRKEPVPELVAAAVHAQGTHLWLPIPPLLDISRTRVGNAPPAVLPEVVVSGAKSVPKRSNLSVSEMDEHFHKSRPVVLKDAQKGWPAQQKWTFEWMGSTYGNEVMPCSDLAPFFRHCDRGQIRTVSAPLRQFTQYVLGEPSIFHALQEEGRVFYANGWAPFLDHPELLRDVSDRLYCVSDSIPTEGPAKVFNCSLTKIFMGPAGTVSRLHHDTYATHVWLSQIRGRKQFICYPPEETPYLHSMPVDEVDGRTSLFDPEAPDFVQFPEARKAQPYSVVVEEGETVILPARWWHWAKSLTPSITLMRNFVNQNNLQDHMAIRQSAEKAKGRR